MKTGRRQRFFPPSEYFNYLDAIWAFNPNWDDHLDHVDLPFNILSKAGLMLKGRKCQIGMTRCKYLGHVVSCHWKDDDMLEKMGGVLESPTRGFPTAGISRNSEQLEHS